MAKPKQADRIRRLPPYLFAVLDQLKQKAIDRGADLINLGVGDPDLPTPQAILDQLYRSAKDPIPSFDPINVITSFPGSRWTPKRRAYHEATAFLNEESPS